MKIFDVLTHAEKAGPGIWAGTRPSEDQNRDAPEDIVLGAGLHPMNVGVDWLSEIQILRTLDIAAIGECGLDGRPDMPDLNLQEKAFTAQIEIARVKGLPLIVHQVRRIGRTIELLQKHGPLPAGGFFHSFNGPVELLSDISELGMMVSFGASLLKSPKARQAAVAAPSSMLLVESDFPTHPADTATRVLAELTTLRGESVAESAWANAMRLVKPGA